MTPEEQAKALILSWANKFGPEVEEHELRSDFVAHIAAALAAARIEGLREAYDIIYRAVTWKGGMSDVQKRIAALEEANDR